MNWRPPPPAEVWTAIDLYLKEAYPGGPPPAVRARLEALRSTGDDDFYGSSHFERVPEGEPGRYSLRLGNRIYPHMKLVIERAPDGRGHLFRADTHDRHACPPPTSGEYACFCELMAQNQAIARAIESAWRERGLPTFKSYLRNDLARRRAAT